MQPIALGTLEDLAKARYGLAAHCWRCSRWHDFDIDELVGRIGNRDIVRFKPRCKVCGERAEKQVTPPVARFEGYPK